MTTAPSKTAIHTVYKTTDGKQVPSVTTILGVLNKPALLQWAWQCGVDGQDYKLVRDSAANIGTLAHYLILCHLRDEKPDTAQYSHDDIDKAENCLLSYFEWEKGHTIKPLIVEGMYVSEAYRVGGTVDLVAEIDGQPGLIDHKTGKGIYGEMIYQVAAYEAILAEHGHGVQTVRILRIPRTEDEAFEERLIGRSELDRGWQVFQHCLAIYRLQQGGRNGQG